ncbi:hypothetical protein PAXRUDRAFT_88005, partial [Paxillus rubicundulus Ve08.2h10]
KICRDKWKRLRSTYDTVKKICNTSGFTYSEDSGVDIKDVSKHLWVDYMKVKKPEGRPFLKQGMAVYAKMDVVMLLKAKGRN